MSHDVEAYRRLPEPKKLAYWQELLKYASLVTLTANGRVRIYIGGHRG